jgi:hypothetical protein
MLQHNALLAKCVAQRSYAEAQPTESRKIARCFRAVGAVPLPGSLRANPHESLSDSCRVEFSSRTKPRPTRLGMSVRSVRTGQVVQLDSSICPTGRSGPLPVTRKSETASAAVHRQNLLDPVDLDAVVCDARCQHAVHAFAAKPKEFAKRQEWKRRPRQTSREPALRRGRKA